MKLSDVEILRFKRFAKLNKNKAYVDIATEDLEKLISTIEAQRQEIDNTAEVLRKGLSDTQRIW